ncbi:hypothetical protein E2C01_089478 [Portunus trituberculatus]|uniref:Uncharacterized protein n=1 Tax=Portunus trituberculatus TaxID=210409 RepID=A0A5B7JPP8_PORTR|nr:hypothetical protein [Portunus trituberculatus]
MFLWDTHVSVNAKDTRAENTVVIPQREGSEAHLNLGPLWVTDGSSGPGVPFDGYGRGK